MSRQTKRDYSVVRSGAGFVLLLGLAALLAAVWMGGPPDGPAESARAAPLPPPSPTCTPNWQYVPSPDPSGESGFYGLATTPQSDVWAFGYHNTGTADLALIERWTGTAWQVVPSPNPGDRNSSLLSATALAADNIWAVGHYSSSQAAERTLVEHWDGAQWTIVPSPNANTNENYLFGIGALAADDIWAVGAYYDGSGEALLFEHWDGMQWSVVPGPPRQSDYERLESVSGVAANDVWAVGYSFASPQLVVVVHWDGIQWSYVAAPNPTNYEYLYGVTAVATNDVWAVGGGSSYSLVEHWDGTAWTVVPSPNLGNHRDDLYAVAAGAPNDLWAVGLCGNFNQPCGPFIVHWDGSAWTLAPTDTPAPYPELMAVTALGPNNAWAAGDNGTYGHILTEHLTTACPPPSPTVTAPPASPSPTATATPTATPTPCSPVWSVVPGLNFPGQSSALNAVGAAATDDVWVVGGYTSGTLIEHWDGSQWTQASTSLGGTLLDVSVLSANDVWAAGLYTGGYERTLTMHWDGSSWSTVPTPQFTLGARLNAVAAVAPNDVWAVGLYQVPGIYDRTLILHWDGSQWNQIPSPNVGPNNNVLLDVAAIAANDVWAVGLYYNYNGLLYGSLALHWDGQSWSVVPSPHGGTDNRLTSVAAVASNDVWAVGGSEHIVHWDGSAWSLVAHPPVPGGEELEGIAARVANDVWAVGYNAYYIYTLTLHWDGSAWSIVPSPNPGSADNYLFGAFAVAANDVWAVGQQWSGGYFTTLIEHYADPCVTPSPSPTLSASPTSTATPTVTPTLVVPATGTPAHSATPASPSRTPRSTPAATRTMAPPTHTPTTRTATPCALGFGDVQPADYFYTPVLYLACHGVISGYADGTFRPYTDTTRSQMAKIVVLGFALPLRTPGSGYAFADVPPTFPFFAVIETAAADNIVSGYACGGASEPCDDQQRPYFRPYANVTRAQLAKIVVLGAGWAPSNPATGTFADMAPGSAFYAFVETAACGGIINGYGCGGVGEPCDPQRRPYFRPANPATRGQIAKIVYLVLGNPAGCAAPGVITAPGAR